MGNVIAIAGLLALTTAILVLPAWKLAVYKFGKVNAWFAWSLTMAATNLLFVFVNRDTHIFLFFVVSAINGAPLGAKFLADSILADIIDYDEFLTGMRTEATYFMFKSFLPKIVQIPSSALPIAMLGLFGYRSPEGGRVQDQPESVSIYIRCVAFISFIVSCVAYLLKRRYPIRDRHLDDLAASIAMHKDGEWARDPISRRLYKPMSIQSDEEQEAFRLFNHFSTETLQRVFVDLETGLPEDARKERFLIGCQHLANTMKQQLYCASVLLFLALVGSGFSIPLLFNEHFQFIPTICVVGAGAVTAATGFAILRLRAALKLASLVQADTVDFYASVGRLLNHQADLARIGKTSVDEPDHILTGRKLFLHNSDGSPSALTDATTVVEERSEPGPCEPLQESHQDSDCSDCEL